MTSGARMLQTARSNGAAGDGDQIGLGELDAVGHFVALRVAFGDGEGGGIAVGGEHGGGAEFRGGDGEDAAAAADVGDPVARLDEFGQRVQAQARRRVSARPEGGAGIEDDDVLARLRPGSAPSSAR